MALRYPLQWSRNRGAGGGSCPPPNNEAGGGTAPPKLHKFLSWNLVTYVFTSFHIVLCLVSMVRARVYNLRSESIALKEFFTSTFV